MTENFRGLPPDLPVPVDVTVVDPAHLDEEAGVPGVVRAAMREGRVLAAA